MPLPEPAWLTLAEAVNRVADRCAVTVEQAKAGLLRAGREFELIFVGDGGQRAEDLDTAEVDWLHSEITWRTRTNTFTLHNVRLSRESVDDWTGPPVPSAWGVRMQGSAKLPTEEPQQRAPIPARPSRLRAPKLGRVRDAIRSLWPDGVPPPSELSNVELERQIDRHLKSRGLTGVGRDTVLRAAGRRN
jgi:hypothetical protein